MGLRELLNFLLKKTNLFFCQQTQNKWTIPQLGNKKPRGQGKSGTWLVWGGLS